MFAFRLDLYLVKRLEGIKIPGEFHVRAGYSDEPSDNRTMSWVVRGKTDWFLFYAFLHLQQGQTIYWSEAVYIIEKIEI